MKQDKPPPNKKTKNVKTEKAITDYINRQINKQCIKNYLMKYIVYD